MSSHSRKIFTPDSGLIWNNLFMFNMILVLISVFNILKIGQLVAIALPVNILVVLAWLLGIRKFLTIIISNNTIEGPSGGFGRATIPFREILTDKTRSRREKTRYLGYVDLWSKKGTRVRIYTLTMNHRQVRHIFDLIERYPFRESESPDPQPPAASGPPDSSGL